MMDKEKSAEVIVHRLQYFYFSQRKKNKREKKMEGLNLEEGEQ